MKRILTISLLLCGMLYLSGCSTPSQQVKHLRLGMTPDEVVEEMGRPYAVRASKLYRDGTFTEVWEYIPSIFSVALFADRYDKSYWIYFEDGRVVQWGEPGDFTSEGDYVLEFMPDRRTR